MGRVVDRQTARAEVSTKEMVYEFHTWDKFDDTVLFATEASERTVELDRYGRVLYVYPDVVDDLGPNDEFSRMVRGDFDFGDDFPPMDYHDELYLETTYHP